MAIKATVSAYPITSEGWAIIDGGVRVDCIPVGDRIDHISADNCPCKPFRSSTPYGTPLGIHHSFDGREFAEPDHTEEFEDKVVN